MKPKHFAAIAVALFFSLVAAAQSGQSIKLTLVDADSSEPVSFATVSLTPAGTQKATKYVLSADNGSAVLDGVRKGKYTVKAELLGYKPYSVDIEVAKEAIDLGQVKMKPDKEVLDAANVSAVGNPIIVKKDTVEYNASSFKTTDNDMLEELLKKLPGVEVSEDGSVTANGKAINKITIDGKTFFLDDPQLASKNIPAKIVQKIKVVDKKSDQALFTGIDDGEEETVIDLSIRPGMMNGWFGNIVGGGGHDVPSEKSSYDDDRFQGGAMIGRFTDKSQISIILNGNNTNNRGFNDIAGNMMRGSRGGGGGMGRGQGGWGRGNGITTSWMGGLNGAFTLFDGDMQLGSNYLYNGTSKTVEESSLKNTFLNDGRILINNNDGYSLERSDGHRFGVRLEHKFSETTSILFEPQLNFGKGSFNEYSSFDTDTDSNGRLTRTNDGFSDSQGINDNVSTSGFFLFRHRLGKPGRTVSANIRYSYSNNDLDGFNQSLTYSEWDGEKWGASEIVNQHFLTNSHSASLSGRLVYTEPITDVLFVEANYQYGWNKSVSDKDTYNALVNNVYDMDGEMHLSRDVAFDTHRDETYSSSILNRYINQRAGASLQYQKEGTWVNVGFSAVPTDTYNETNGQIYEDHTIKWAPQIMIGREFNENANMRFFYFGRSSQPSTSQLMTVPDNSNPLSVSLGNPYLQPFFNHDIRGRFGYTNKETFFSFNANLEGGMVQNPIVNASWYDKAGARYSIPVNGPTSANANLRFFLNSPIAKSNFTIFSMSMVGYNVNSSYQGTDKFDSGKYYNPETAEYDYELFHKDMPDISESRYFDLNRIQSLNLMERVRVTYRNDFVELTAGGRTRFSRSYYSLENVSANVNAQWNNQINGSMNWTIPGGVGLVADVDYNWYRGYTTPQPDEVIANAQISKLLFKDKFTLALRAYDIFAQSKNLHVTDNDNFHQEVRNNTLGRYVIISLTYRFGNFKGNEGQRGGMGGPGGRPGMGGGRPGMGGGPGMGGRR